MAAHPCINARDPLGSPSLLEAFILENMRTKRWGVNRMEIWGGTRSALCLVSKPHAKGREHSVIASIYDIKKKKSPPLKPP